MQCSKCSNINVKDADYCSKCGTRLISSGVKPQALKRVLFLIAVLLLAGGFLYYFKGIFLPFEPLVVDHLPGEDKISLDLSEQTDKSAELLSPSVEIKHAPETVSAAPVVPGKIPAHTLPVGDVSIYDPWGNEIAVIASVVVDGSWVALPERACLGGVQWVFRARGSDFRAEIDSGQWRKGDPVGLWHLEKPMDDILRLHPWQAGNVLGWHSLVSGRAEKRLPIKPDWQYGYILHSPVPSHIDEPGVFLQDGRVTGWTFGSWLGGAYLWNRAADRGIEREVTVGDFYSITFAGGREEQFVRALAVDAEIIPAERLQLILDGFRLDAKVDLLDIPESLHPDNMLTEARLLAWELRQGGMANRVVELVREDIFRRIADFDLMKIVAGAQIESRGFASAVNFIENLQDVFLDGGDLSDFQALHVKIYQLWFTQVFSEGDLEKAGEVLSRGRSFFAEDPQLHLDEVELLLARGDWAGAEEMFYSRTYPDKMQKRANRLVDSISRLKGRESKIVLSFSPGSNHIPVTARVNDRVEFAFLVDTGASLVSIPLSLVNDLGLVINKNTPRRTVDTAGGKKEAWLVRLDSLELGGWLVEDVDALVVDIAEERDFGLLGMNFLSRFQMEVDSDEGVLILTPQ